MEINIAKDYTTRPGLRYEWQTPERSGQKFRDDYLVPAFEKIFGTSEKLVVNIDGTNGYPSSFLEEAFGGLARLKGAKAVTQILVIVAKELPEHKFDIENFLSKVQEHQEF